MIESINSSAISFDDVVTALGETDPNSTNSNKLRQAIGRGSFATIQKHLDSIRVQRAQAAQPAAVPVPAAPPELLQMWGAAVQIASAQVFQRLDSVAQEREKLANELVSSRSDVEALAEELESTTGLLEAAVQDEATAKQLAAEELALMLDSHSKETGAMRLELAAILDSHSKETAVMRLELESARHQVEKSQLESQLIKAAFQTTIDKLTDQVGELKGLLHTRA